MDLLLALLLACRAASSAPQVEVREALDVPPPPRQVSLDLGPLPAGAADVAPGAVLVLDGVPVEVVDARQVDGGRVLTVYVDAERASWWVEAGTIAWDPRAP